MCSHSRVRPYHGPYVSMRCPDCGRWIKGVINRTTGYVRLREVDEEELTHVIAVVRVRRPWVKDEGIVEGLLVRDRGELRVLAGGDLNLLENVEIIERMPNGYRSRE